MSRDGARRPVHALRRQQPVSSGAFHAVAASFLGWTLDAFDFFVVVFLYDTLAEQFHVPEGADRWNGGVDAADAPSGRADFRVAGGPAMGGATR